MSDEWRSVAAASVARIEIGGTPAREQPTFWSDQDGGHAWASIADLHSRDVVETAEYISDLGVRSSNVKLVSAGTPIMSFKLTIGRTALAGRDLYTNEAIAAFFGDPTQVDRRFLFHTLPGSARSVITDVAIKGATLNKKSLSSMKLLLPSIEEQRRIADVLDSLDDQIQATKQIIGKYVAQEHGLVDDIVSHAVHRAVDGDQACVFAHLGSIVQEHGGVMQTGPFGSQLHAYDYVGEGVPVVMPQDIVDGRIALDSIAQVPERLARSLARHRMVPGDVVFARRGDLERCAEITHREQAWLCGTGCLLVRTTPSVLSAGWLTLVYRHEFGQRHVRAHAVGSTMANLNRTILANLEIPLPSLADQQEAVSAVAAQDRQIELEGRHLAKLRSTKSGLMTDLLTGRVRIPEGAGS